MPDSIVRVLHRPARIESDLDALECEFRAARWAHHRLLDFEDEHQRVLDEVADECAPGIIRVGRILARLSRRKKRRERATSGTWSPDPRLELAKRMESVLIELRRRRNADPRWKDALRWADDPVGAPKQVRRRRAKHPSKVKRRKSESDEAWAKRFELLTNDEPEEHYQAKLANPPRETRREMHRKHTYASRRCYWGTWNAALKSVDQARSSVLTARRAGMPAKWRRPRWSDPGTIAVEPGGIRIIERGRPWWTVEMRIGVRDEWVRFRCKGGNWHDVSEGARILGAKLTRRRDGMRWAYSVSITIELPAVDTAFAKSGVVALDWGHREHGHDNAREGMRVFTWRGDDGQRGEVLLPRVCREALDAIDMHKHRLDEAFNARKLSMGLLDRNRYGYRKRLLAQGVRTAEETRWLQWEMKLERRIMACRNRISNVRGETYKSAVRMLRDRYGTIVFEDESVAGLKLVQKEEKLQRRKRSNRDLSARYEFVSLCEQSGANVITVPARNTTRECPDCGYIGENGPELLYACPGCGVVRDKDDGACRVILTRAQAALAMQGETA